jgi:hypothetical protein
LSLFSALQFYTKLGRQSCFIHYGTQGYDSLAAGNPNPVLVEGINQAGLQGRANTSADKEEVWADMFMTWVLDGLDFTVNGSTVGRLLRSFDNLPPVEASDEVKLQFLYPVAKAAHLLRQLVET